MKRRVPLEPAAEEVCNQSSVPPLIFQLPPEQGRKALEEMQNTPVYKYPANISSDCINTGIGESIPVYFIAPKDEKIRNIIFTVQVGYLEAFIHTRNWLVNFVQGQIHWLYSLNIPGHQKQNILRRLNNVILFFLI